MATLHIEHEISDLQVWLGAFRQFDEARRNAGVTAQRVSQPQDDTHHIVVQLDFPSVEQAEGFKAFLETVIWSSPDNAPALVGTPRARVLMPVEP
jgi:hypothetical protein